MRSWASFPVGVVPKSSDARQQLRLPRRKELRSQLMLSTNLSGIPDSGQFIERHSRFEVPCEYMSRGHRVPPGMDSFNCILPGIQIQGVTTP